MDDPSLTEPESLAGFSPQQGLPLVERCRETRVSDIFSVEQLDLQFSNGEARRYERLRGTRVGAVIVVPMLDDDRVILIREYAAGLHRYEIGLPKGRVEPGESLLDGANRELKEEIGYGARTLELVKALSLAPAYMSHMTQIVLATDLYPQRLPGDEPEPIEPFVWRLSRLDELMMRDDFSEGRSIAALHMIKVRLHG